MRVFRDYFYSSNYNAAARCAGAAVSIVATQLLNKT